MAQCAKHKREDLYLGPNAHIRSPAQWHRSITRWGKRGGQTPEADCPISLPNQQTPGSVGTPVVHELSSDRTYAPASNPLLKIHKEVQ